MAPVGGDKRYFYFDPLDQLSDEGQERWADPNGHDQILNQALAAAGG